MPNNYLPAKSRDYGIIYYLVIGVIALSFYHCEPWNLERLTITDFSLTVMVDTVSIDSTKIEVSGKYNIIPTIADVPVESFGHCYSMNNSIPTLDDNKMTFNYTNQSPNPFISQISGLSPGTVYYVRAYVIINDSIYYSNAIGIRTLNLNTQNRWTQFSNFDGPPRHFATGFSIGANGYVGLGLNQTGDFWQYNSTSNIWTPINPYLGSGRSEMISFSSTNGKGYVGFGNKISYYSDLWAYDPSTENWHKQPPFPGGAKTAVYGFCIGSKAFILVHDGGACEAAKLEVWEFDTIDTSWTKKKPFPGIARFYPTGFVINGKGYFGTGVQCANQTLLRDLWEYDPAIDTWALKSEFPDSPRSNAVAFSINDKGYIGTGYLSTGGVNTFWEYDPLKNIWKQMASLSSIGRSYAVGFSIGHKGYVCTGINSSGFVTSDFWVFQ